jgi:hypothetical protein
MAGHSSLAEIVSLESLKMGAADMAIEDVPPPEPGDMTAKRT